MRIIDRQRLAALTEQEANRFAAEHPNSKALFERPRVAARRRADELDGEMGRAISGFRR
jgi:hypothetical protein